MGQGQHDQRIRTNASGKGLIQTSQLQKVFHRENKGFQFGPSDKCIFDKRGALNTTALIKRNIDVDMRHFVGELDDWDSSVGNDFDVTGKVLLLKLPRKPIHWL